MKQLLKVAIAGLVLAVGVDGAAQAACGNLNNDGAGVTSSDVSILGQCAAGSCPTLGGAGICGTGNPLSCGDIVADGVIDSLDVDALRIYVTGGDPLFDICTGPGPDQAGCPGPVTLGSPSPTSITSNTTWPAGCQIILGGTVTVETPPGGPATVLTIEPGAIIKGATGTTVANPSALIFELGSRIDAVGNPAQPIIFTSTAAPGARSKGDWGGVVFNGRGTVNGPGCTFTSEGLPFSFGGCEADYNAGIAKFARFEMAGLDFSLNNELNIFTMNGIGTQTDFSFLEAVNGDDDCFEWFGGTSNHDHMVAAACGDDAFDWQLGFTGSIQHGIYIQNGTQTDTGSDSRGIESDNSEFDNTATPYSNPQLCNMTLVGAQNQAGANNGSDAGILARRGVRWQIANSLVTAFADNCVELRDAETTKGACTDANADGSPESLAGNLIIRNSVLASCGSVGGGPYEIAKNGDALDADDANADTGPCDTTAVPGCTCDTESWYDLIRTGYNVPNVNGVAPTVTFTNTGANLDQYPALDNAACTGVESPYTCCTGVGTGTCRALWDARPVFTGAAPAPFACSSLNPLFDDPGYLGGLNPAASCTGTSCDWMSKPWIEFAIN